MTPRAPAPYRHWTVMSTVSTAALYVQTFLSPDGKIELTVREPRQGGTAELEFAIAGKPARVYRTEADARASL